MKNKTAKMIVELLSNNLHKMEELEKRIDKMDNTSRINAVAIIDLEKRLNSNDELIIKKADADDFINHKNWLYEEIASINKMIGDLRLDFQLGKFDNEEK